MKNPSEIPRELPMISLAPVVTSTMSPVGSLLWRNLRVYKIYGANTDVGKTVFTSILCNASRRIWKEEATAYLKPVSTGSDDDADDKCLSSVLSLESKFILTCEQKQFNVTYTKSITC